MQDTINSLPPPNCPEDLGANCPGPFIAVDPATGKEITVQKPFARVASESRPGELDVTVRCQFCQACAHYTLDSATGEVLDAEALVAHREGEASGVRHQAPVNDAPGLKVSPAAAEPALPPSADPAPEPEHGE